MTTRTSPEFEFKFDDMHRARACVPKTKELTSLMKRCPKCSRTFPDDNQKFCTIDGGLLVAEVFDPNATIASSPSAPLNPPTAPAGGSQPRESNETVAGAPTAVLNRNTGPTGAPTIVNSAPLPQTPSAPLPQRAAQPPQTPAAVAVPPKKKSKLPLIIGILALLLVLGVGAVVAAFFLFIKPRLDQNQGEQGTVVQNSNQNDSVNQNANTAANSNTETTTTPAEYVPPPDTEKFANSKANLDGKLADHYLDFSFYYPKGWAPDTKAGVPGATNFAKVERSLPPDFTQENFAVGWYTSKGTYEADSATYPQLVELMGTNLANGFPEYKKVSEGPTKINSLDGYEFRFTSVSRNTEKGDITLWGRVVFLPTGVSGDQTGATLIMLATSLAPELSGVEDVGTKGQMPVILDSFRFGKP